MVVGAENKVERGLSRSPGPLGELAGERWAETG